MNISTCRFFLTLIVLISFGWLTAQDLWETTQDEWNKVEEWANTHYESAKPPPFEKIYVGPDNLMTTSQGCYYINSWGQKEKVCAVLYDCHGCYVIRITRQCPVCGRCCDGNKSPEGYDCPFGKIEVLPHIWSEP